MIYTEIKHQTWLRGAVYVVFTLFPYSCVCFEENCEIFITLKSKLKHDIQYRKKHTIGFTKRSTLTITREKGRYLTHDQSYDKSPYTNRNVKRAKWQHKQRHKKFDHTAVTDRLRTVSWSKYGTSILMNFRRIYHICIINNILVILYTCKMFYSKTSCTCLSWRLRVSFSKPCSSGTNIFLNINLCDIDMHLCNHNWSAIISGARNSENQISR